MRPVDGAVATTKSHRLSCNLAAVMVIKKGSYLEEDRGSGGIRSDVGLIIGQFRCFFPVYFYIGIKG